MTKIKNAAGRAPKAATNMIQQQSYTSLRPPSSPFAGRILPGRRRCASSDATSLGLLVLMLSQTGELPARQARRGWALAERWLGDLVGTKRMQEAV
jgi:hypothetical protein